MTKEQWLTAWRSGWKYAVLQTPEGRIVAQPLPSPTLPESSWLQILICKTLGEAWQRAYGCKPTWGFNMQDEEGHRETFEVTDDES